MCSVSVFSPFRSMRIYAGVRTHAFLHSRERLIGRRDRTAIIDRSRCRVEETSFREAVSNREAQPTLVPT